MSVRAAPSPERMHALDRRLLPWAIVGFLGVLVLAAYTISITVTRVKHDGRLTMKEARYLVRSKRLVGLTLAQAAPHVEGTLTPASDQPEDALVEIDDLAGALLRLQVREGRITDAKLVLP